MNRSTILLFCLTFAAIFLSRHERLHQRSWILGDGTVRIESRMSVAQLAQELVEQARLHDAEEFLWVARTHGWNRVQRGSYYIDPLEPIHHSLRRMGLGEQDPIPVTILPGLEKTALARSIAVQLDVDSAQVMTYFTQTTDLSTRLRLTPSQLFGRITPETYLTFWTTDLESFIERVNRETLSWLQNSFTEELASSRFSVDEIFTLASIVEWEARHDHEREVISGLYQNRLRRRMRLQADPTVIYAIGEKRRLLYRDYQVVHPYNTYIIKGLPPGPITNPSRRSIEAVLKPTQHEYLYMVAKPDGTHEFNRDYSTHLAAARRWQEWIREQYRIKAASER